MGFDGMAADGIDDQRHVGDTRDVRARRGGRQAHFPLKWRVGESIMGVPHRRGGGDASRSPPHFPLPHASPARANE